MSTSWRLRCENGACGAEYAFLLHVKQRGLSSDAQTWGHLLSWTRKVRQNVPRMVLYQRALAALAIEPA